MRKTTEERFWEKVRKTDGCWEWMAFKNGNGYGGFRYIKRSIAAHRASWMINNGPIPKGILVCHKCDNPPCVRPSHLFLGTNQDNKIDSVQKGRAYTGGRPPHRIGEAHPNHILTRDQVLKIRKEYTGKYGEQTALGEKYGVHRSTIKLVVSGKNWAHC